MPDEFARHEHYQIYRRYVEHEDELINQRLLWGVNIQGFLFATYGLCIQKLAAGGASQPEPFSATWLLRWLVVLLPVLGICISVVSMSGVLAAWQALDALYSRWKRIDAEYQITRGLPLSPLPELRGGGALKAHGLGLVAPLVFPLLFAVAWAVVVVFSLMYFFHSPKPQPLDTAWPLLRHLHFR